MIRVIRRLLELVDVNASGIADGETLVWDADADEFVAGVATGGGSQDLTSVLDEGNDAGGVRITGLGNPSAAQDADTKAARDAAIATAVSNLVNAAPGLLDTLDELAAALGDDANFAATITTVLAGKQPLDADLTALAALTTTSFGRGLLTLANQAALLAAAGAAAAVHAHAGEDITSGTIADARIASTIARDSEVASGLTILRSQVASAFVSPSGDASGDEDMGVAQETIDDVHDAGGGTVQFTFAPNAAPYWIPQLKIRAGVIVAGFGRMGTVVKAPLGQPAGLHMCVLGGDDPGAEGHCGPRDLTFHGNNGFANVYPANWGLQDNAFGGIHWAGGGSGGLGSLVNPFASDRLLQINNVMVVSVPGKGAYFSNNASSLIDGLFTCWTGDTGIDFSAYDMLVLKAIAGFAGVTLADPLGAGAIAAALVGTSAVQIASLKVWWPQVNFKQTDPITWDPAAGLGLAITGGDGFIGDNLFAQDCGYGFVISGGSGARIRGHAQNCKVAVNPWGGDDFDIDVSVDYGNNGSLVAPQYAIASVHGAAIRHSKIRVKYSSSISFSHGPGYFDTNGTALAGSDVEVKCAGSQDVDYDTDITIDAYLAPITRVGTLTGDITIHAPENTSGASNFTGVQPYHDQWYVIRLSQDETGGRTATFDANHATAGAVPDTPLTTTTLRFQWNSDTALWEETNRSTSTPPEDTGEPGILEIGNSDAGDGYTNWPANYVVLIGPIEVPATGTLKRIFVRAGAQDGAEGSIDGHLRVEAYADDGGAAGDLLVLSDEITILPTDDFDDLEFTVDDTAVTEGDVLWLGFATGAGGNIGVRATQAQPSGASFYVANPGPGIPDPISGLTGYTDLYEIWAEIETA